jgi:hypothetical protein
MVVPPFRVAKGRSSSPQDVRGHIHDFPYRTYVARVTTKTAPDRVSTGLGTAVDRGLITTANPATTSSG